ncbi:HAD domain-containing protein [Micromonospora sp. LZ34]
MVFLDVDGMLIPFGVRSASHVRAVAGVGVQPVTGSGNPLLDRLDPDDGRRLLELGCELVWATTWMAEANEVISPRLGLPDPPVVEWPDGDDDQAHGLHWKTMPLTQWAAGRPFVWLDDEITDADRRWVAAHHPGRALVRRVDPQVGLTEADFSTIRRWLGQGYVEG